MGVTNEGERAELMRLMHGSGWPRHLVRAVFDNHTFRVKLRTGETYDFDYAEAGVSLTWVRLFGCSGEGLKEHWTERGVDVRVADIVWIADLAS